MMLNLIFIYTYTVLVFLVLRFCVTLFNFLSNPKLGIYGKHFSDRVSVLIDANADTGSLLNLLSSIQTQDYQHIEVIIGYDHHAEIPNDVASFCANDNRFLMERRMSGSINPAEEAIGSYLLFLGVNTIIHKGLINSLIYRTKVFNLALLSVIPTQSFTGVKNYCLIPLNNFLLLNLMPLRLVRLIPSAVVSAGSNQCMFFDATVYRKYEWEQRFKDRLPEALEVVKAVKQERFKVETLLGHKLIYTVIPEHIDEFLLKTGQLLFKKLGNNIFAAIFYILLVVAGPVFMLVNYEYNLLILPVGLIFLTRIMISFLSRQSPLWNILLHPLQMVMLVVSLFRAMAENIRQRISVAN